MRGRGVGSPCPRHSFLTHSRGHHEHQTDGSPGLSSRALGLRRSRLSRSTGSWPHGSATERRAETLESVGPGHDRSGPGLAPRHPPLHANRVRPWRARGPGDDLRAGGGRLPAAYAGLDGGGFGSRLDPARGGRSRYEWISFVLRGRHLGRRSLRVQPTGQPALLRFRHPHRVGDRRAFAGPRGQARGHLGRLPDHPFGDGLVCHGSGSMAWSPSRGPDSRPASQL